MGSEIEKDDVAGPWPSEYKKRRGKLENQNCRRQTDGNQSERKRESTVSIRPFGFLFPPLHFSRMEIHGPSLVNPLLREYVNDFQLPRDLHVKISALGSCHWHFSTCGFSFGYAMWISPAIFSYLPISLSHSYKKERLWDGERTNLQERNSGRPRVKTTTYRRPPRFWWGLALHFQSQRKTKEEIKWWKDKLEIPKQNKISSALSFLSFASSFFWLEVVGGLVLTKMKLFFYVMTSSLPPSFFLKRKKKVDGGRMVIRKNNFFRWARQARPEFLSNRILLQLSWCQGKLELINFCWKEMDEQRSGLENLIVLMGKNLESTNFSKDSRFISPGLKIFMGLPYFSLSHSSFPFSHIAFLLKKKAKEKRRCVRETRWDIEKTGRPAVQKPFPACFHLPFTIRFLLKERKENG